MNKFCIYVPLPAYIAQWLTFHLGSPVTFPPKSPQNAVIRTFIAKLPKNETPDTGADGRSTPIVIPESTAKPPSVYNHMGPLGKKAVAESVKDLFTRAIWADLSPLKDSEVGLTSQIYAWCEANGIDIDHAGSVRQLYYRIREQFGETDINLRKFSREK